MQPSIMHCPTCGSEKIKLVCHDWSGAYHGQAYGVPALEFYECPVCGERVFEREALAKIRSYSPAYIKRRPKLRHAPKAPTGVTPRATPSG
jgi:predicted RNA-binding Zn-ribbon protein involved in translation (DUF1610 family)